MSRSNLWVKFLGSLFGIGILGVRVSFIRLYFWMKGEIIRMWKNPQILSFLPARSSVWGWQWGRLLVQLPCTDLQLIPLIALHFSLPFSIVPYDSVQLLLPLHRLFFTACSEAVACLTLKIFKHATDNSLTYKNYIIYIKMYENSDFEMKRLTMLKIKGIFLIYLLDSVFSTLETTVSCLFSVI